MTRSRAARAARTAVAAVLAAPLLAVAVPSYAASDNAAVGFGRLFHDGEVVGTVATPTSMPGQGVDDMFAFPGAKATGQLSVTAVAPGDVGYHGGRWAVHAVEWHVAPYLLTSDEALLAAAAAGDLSVTRVPERDFVCSVQKLPGS